jgi:hypothetical protein
MALLSRVERPAVESALPLWNESCRATKPSRWQRSSSGTKNRPIPTTAPLVETSPEA